MQFTLSHKIGQQKVNVLFTANIVTLKLLNIEKLKETFARIGGEFQNDYTFDFPLFITSDIISEIIHNTCFVCGGLMRDGRAFDNTYVSFDDFGNDAGKRGSTQSKVGPAKIVNVRKCTECGHSHT